MKYPEIDQYYANPSEENRDKLMDILGQEHFKISDLGVTSRVFPTGSLKILFLRLMRDNGYDLIYLSISGSKSSKILELWAYHLS